MDDPSRLCSTRSRTASPWRSPRPQATAAPATPPDDARRVLAEVLTGFSGGDLSLEHGQARRARGAARGARPAARDCARARARRGPRGRASRPASGRADEVRAAAERAADGASRQARDARARRGA